VEKAKFSTGRARRRIAVTHLLTALMRTWACVSSESGNEDVARPALGRSSAAAPVRHRAHFGRARPAGAGRSSQEFGPQIAQMAREDPRPSNSCVCALYPSIFCCHRAVRMPMPASSCCRPTVVTALLEAGRVRMTELATAIRLDTLAGRSSRTRVSKTDAASR